MTELFLFSSKRALIVLDCSLSESPHHTMTMDDGDVVWQAVEQ